MNTDALSDQQVYKTHAKYRNQSTRACKKAMDEYGNSLPERVEN